MEQVLEKHYLFSDKALLKLLLPPVVEQIGCYRRYGKTSHPCLLYCRKW